MAEDEFELWLGRAGTDRSFAGELKRSMNLAKGASSRSTTRSTRPRFTGARLGRGSAVAAVLQTRTGYGADRRRVITKTSIVRLAGKGAKGAAAHLRYLQRDGTTREGERGAFYGKDHEGVDGREFLERGSHDRHQFRIILSPEDGDKHPDLQRYTRSVMRELELDLKTSLDWVAVDHFNTGHPHCHVLLRGVDELGKDLIIAPAYISHGIRERAEEIINLDLGPKSQWEVMAAKAREVTQERFTGLDKRLIHAIGEDGLVRPGHSDGIEQSSRAGRLQHLKRMGLAEEVGRGTWKLDAELEPTLRAMGKRGDIIAMISERMARLGKQVSHGDYDIYDPNDTREPLVGKVMAHGLGDEVQDRRFVIIDGTDGLSHYVDIGTSDMALSEGQTISIEPVNVTIKQADHTIAEIAAQNQGRYSVDIHLDTDPNATETYAEAHIRRLEALRRLSKVAERDRNGVWTIAPNHIERVTAHEASLVRAQPVKIESLAERPLNELTRYDGATWLDKALTSQTPETLGHGFGAEVRRALNQRRQWLVEEGIATVTPTGTHYPGDLTTTLRARELRRFAAQLSRELNLNFVEAKKGDAVEGRLTRQVRIGSERFGMIQKAREFSLVPWQRSLDRQIGREIAGRVTSSGISWTKGRTRGPEIGM